MSTKKATKKVVKVDGSIEVTPVPSDELVSNRLYSNYVQVAQSPFDFTLRFCDAPPIYDVKEVAGNGGVFPIPIVTEIVIPFDLMPSLIKALESQYKKHPKFPKGDASGDESKDK